MKYLNARVILVLLTFNFIFCFQTERLLKPKFTNNNKASYNSNSTLSEYLPVASIEKHVEMIDRVSSNIRKTVEIIDSEKMKVKSELEKEYKEKLSQITGKESNNKIKDENLNKKNKLLEELENKKNKRLNCLNKVLEKVTLSKNKKKKEEEEKVNNIINEHKKMEKYKEIKKQELKQEQIENKNKEYKQIIKNLEEIKVKKEEEENQTYNFLSFTIKPNEFNHTQINSKFSKTILPDKNKTIVIKFKNSTNDE